MVDPITEKLVVFVSVILLFVISIAVILFKHKKPKPKLIPKLIPKSVDKSNEPPAPKLNYI
jgi:hypothetical protein